MERRVSRKQLALFITASVLAGLSAFLAIADSIEGYRQLKALKAQITIFSFFFEATRFLGAVFLSVVSAALIRGKTQAAMMILPLTFYFVPSVLHAFLDNSRGLLFGIFVPQYWSFHWEEILFSFWLPAFLYAIVLMTVLPVIPTRIPAIVLVGLDIIAPLAFGIFRSDSWYLFSYYQWSKNLFLAAMLLSVIALPVKAHTVPGQTESGLF